MWYQSRNYCFHFFFTTIWTFSKSDLPKYRNLDLEISQSAILTYQF